MLFSQIAKCTFFLLGHLMRDAFDVLTGIASDLGIYQKYDNSSFEIKFELFTKEKVEEPEILTTCGEISQKILFQSFDPKKPVKILIHGWRKGVDGLMIQTIKNAYLPRLDYNVIAVDWSNQSFEFYTKARNRVPLVGETVARFVLRLVHDYQVDMNNIHIVGHSLGANIAFVAGKALNSTVGRITGLDPASPMFRGTPDRFNKNCAKFVDALHTCDNVLSISGSIGVADFFPNGGSAPQPGCLIEDSFGRRSKKSVRPRSMTKMLGAIGLCSHRRAYMYFAESIVNPKAFPATYCDSRQKYESNKCSGEVAYMGEFVSKNVTGDHYLKTNDASPFGQGEHES